MVTTSLIDSIDACALRELKRRKVPGLTVGVVQNGRTELRCYGVASLESGEPVRPETVFRVASITKPFVATLAMTLVEEGRLVLDVPVTGLSLPYERITLRQLLSHQAGLAGEWPVPQEQYGSGDDALERLAADPARPGPVGPGELFSYSNAGFWLAGALAARAAGTTFEEALGRRVLEPLGLGRTGFVPSAPAAVGHVPVAPGAEEHRVAGELPYPRARRPSGGLWSCVADLLAFATHHLGGPGPLGPSSLREMQTPQVGAPGGSYGLGWGLRTARGMSVLEHGGAVPGYRSLLLLAPDEGLVFAALANGDRGQAVIREIVQEALDLGEEESPEAPLPAGALAGLAGRYRSPDGLEISVSPSGGRLQVALADTDPFTGERLEYPPLLARPAGEREFVVVEGEELGGRVEFPRERLVRVFGSLAERVEE